MVRKSKKDLITCVNFGSSGRAREIALLLKKKFQKSGFSEAIRHIIEEKYYDEIVEIAYLKSKFKDLGKDIYLKCEEKRMIGERLTALGVDTVRI